MKLKKDLYLRVLKIGEFVMDYKMTQVWFCQQQEKFWVSIWVVTMI